MFTVIKFINQKLAYNFGKCESSLEQHIDLWKNSEFEDLLFEGETIQKLS